MKSMDGLIDWGKKNQRQKGPTCRGCKLPDAIKADVLKGRSEGLTFPTIARWLKEVKGLDVGEASLQRHFLHHVEDEK